MSSLTKLDYLEDELFNNSGIDFVVGEDHREKLVFLHDAYPDEFDKAIKEVTLFVDNKIKERANEALDMLKADIEHRIKVTSVQNVEPLSNGQYIKVPNMLSAIEDVRKRINE